MNKPQTIGIGVGVLLLLIYFWRDYARERRPVQSVEPMVGTLYRGDIEELTKADGPLPNPPLVAEKHEPIPTVAVSQTNLAHLGFKVSTGPYVVYVVPGQAPYKLVNGTRPSYRKSMVGSPTLGGQVTQASDRQEAEKAISPVHDFRFFDDLIESSDSACLLHERFQKGGMNLELQKLLKWQDFYLLKLSVTNNSEREFFISGAGVSVDGAPLPVQDFMPFSCLPRETEEGIVKFPILDTVGKEVSVQLMESGSKRIFLEINHVEYPF